MSEVYRLKHPFSIPLPSDGESPDTKQITEVVIPDRLKGRHMRKMRIENGSMSGMMDVVADIAGLTPAQIDLMDAGDLLEILGKLSIADQSGLMTGSTATH